MVLRHRDRELLRFEWVEPQGVRVVSVNEAERRFLPLEMHGVVNDEAIEDFTQKRIREICEYGVKADEFLSIQEGECTVNRTAGSVQCTHTSDSLSEQIKQSMRADPFITKMELADLLQISPRWVARKMKDLQSSGEIRRVGADKNGHWEVVDSDEGQ